MTLKTRFKEWFASLFYMREGYVALVYSDGRVWPLRYLFESRREAIGFAQDCLHSANVNHVSVEAVFSGHPPIIIYDSRRDA